MTAKELIFRLHLLGWKKQECDTPKRRIYLRGEIRHEGWVSFSIEKDNDGRLVKQKYPHQLHKASYAQILEFAETEISNENS